MKLRSNTVQPLSHDPEDFQNSLGFLWSFDIEFCQIPKLRLFLAKKKNTNFLKICDNGFGIFLQVLEKRGGS